MIGLLGVQIFGVIFASFMLYVTFLNYRRRELTSKEAVFWLASWLFLLILSIFPTGLDFLVKDVLSFGRRLDFFITIGFMFLMGIIFYIYIVIRKVQNKVDRLVRKIALENKK